MNILYLAHRVPCPPDKGDKLRSYHQLRYLAQRHRVWCAAFADERNDLRYESSLRTSCEDVAIVPLRKPIAMLRGAIGLAAGRSLTQSYYDSGPMRRVIGRWERETRFDSVVAFSSSMAPYALAVPSRRRVLDLCDLDSLKWDIYARADGPPLSWAYAIEGKRLSRLELQWADAFDAVTLVSEWEAAAWRGETIPPHLHVVGNGAVLPPREHIEPDFAEPPVVGFVGAMNYKPNEDAVRWFVERSWPRIRAEHPQAIFRIVGREPTRRVRNLARAPGVQIIGAVENVGAQVRRFQISVAPLRMARGIQNKILEAMAYARPVVATLTAAASLRARPDHEILVADDAVEFAAKVIDLLRSPLLRERIGLAGRTYVARRHNWSPELQRFERIVCGEEQSPPGTTPSPPESESRALAVSARVKNVLPAGIRELLFRFVLHMGSEEPFRIEKRPAASRYEVVNPALAGA